MTYRWNESWSKIMPDGTQVYSEGYENLGVKERVMKSSLYWDVEHSCRQIEPIDEWIKANPPAPPQFMALVQQIMFGHGNNL